MNDGRQDCDQGQLFYGFKLDEVVPSNHLLRRMNGFVTAALADLHQKLRPFYSEIGRPSVDPERRGTRASCFFASWNAGRAKVEQRIQTKQSVLKQHGNRTVTEISLHFRGAARCTQYQLSAPECAPRCRPSGLTLTVLLSSAILWQAFAHERKRNHLGPGDGT